MALERFNLHLDWWLLRFVDKMIGIRAPLRASAYVRIEGGGCGAAGG